MQQAGTHKPTHKPTTKRDQQGEGRVATHLLHTAPRARPGTSPSPTATTKPDVHHHKHKVSSSPPEHTGTISHTQKALFTDVEVKNLKGKAKQLVVGPWYKNVSG